MMDKREGLARQLHKSHKKTCKRMFNWNMRDTTWEELDGTTKLRYRTVAHTILRYLDGVKE